MIGKMVTNKSKQWEIFTIPPNHYRYIAKNVSIYDCLQLLVQIKKEKWQRNV